MHQLCKLCLKWLGLAKLCGLPNVYPDIPKTDVFVTTWTFRNSADCSSYIMGWVYFCSLSSFVFLVVGIFLHTWLILQAKNALSGRNENSGYFLREKSFSAIWREREQCLGEKQPIKERLRTVGATNNINLLQNTDSYLSINKYHAFREIWIVIFTKYE